MAKYWQTIFVLLLGAVFLASGSPFARAQEQEKEGKETFVLEEIVVTAEKREESILEVPISLTAFDATRIDRLGMAGTDDIEQLTPGLQFGDVNEQVGQGTVIRGIGSYAHAQTHNDFAVAFYVDEVYTHSTYGIAPNLFDVDRVEVARGPRERFTVETPLPVPSVSSTKGPPMNGRRISWPNSPISSRNATMRLLAAPSLTG